jgi:putative hydrolase of the HAD superfamily
MHEIKLRHNRVSLVKSNPMLKALIFDFDGLILDTETPEFDALNEAYAEFGQHLPVETFGKVVGSQFNQEFEPLAYLRSLTGKNLDADSFWQKVTRRRLELIEQNPILPGVEAMLNEGKARGMSLAVASSSNHAWVDGHLKRHSLYHYFDTIICKDDVARVKPHPDLFLAALKALSVRADEAVIFEDSPNGILAACRAGVRVVAVPNPITSHLHIEGETLLLDSLANITLEELLSKL